MSYDNNDDLAGSGKDKLSHTHFSLSYSRERVREQRRSFSGRMPFKQSDSLTSTTHTHTHTHTHQPIYFIFSVFWGLGKSSTWFNSHIDIICSFFFSTHTQTKSYLFFSRLTLFRHGSQNPSKLVFLYNLWTFYPITKK
jgi:hypothetical protein